MPNKKISELTPKGSALGATDLMEVSVDAGGGTYTTASVTGQNIQDLAGAGKQDTLVSGTNIKTVNSTSLLGSGNVAVQPTLVSGTNIKTINGSSVLGSGDLVVGGGGSVGIHILNTPISGQKYSLNITGGTNTTVGALGVANRLYFLPFIPKNTITITNLQINVTAGLAGSTASIGIYNDNLGTPSTLIAQSAIFDCSTTGLKTFTTTQTFIAGSTYWFCAIASTQTTLAFTQHPPANLMNIGMLNQSSPIVSRVASGYTIGSLPSSLAPNNTTNDAAGLMVFLFTAQ